MYNKLTPQDWELIRQGKTDIKAGDIDPLEWLDLAATYGGTAAAEIGGGLRGLLGLMYGENIDEAVAGMRNVQGLAYEPRTKDAQMVMGILGDTFAPVEEAVQSVREGAGDTAYDPTGSPLAGAAAYTAPDAALTLGSTLIPPAMGVFPLIRRATRNAPDIDMSGISPESRSLLDTLDLSEPTPNYTQLPSERRTGYGTQGPVAYIPHQNYARTGAANTFSGLDQSLTDIIDRAAIDPETGVKNLKMPMHHLVKKLNSMGVSDLELKESGMDFSGTDTVDPYEMREKFRTRGRNPSDRMELEIESQNLTRYWPDFDGTLLDTTAPVKVVDAYDPVMATKQYGEYYVDITGAGSGAYSALGMNRKRVARNLLKQTAQEFGIDESTLKSTLDSIEDSHYNATGVDVGGTVPRGDRRANTEQILVNTLGPEFEKAYRDKLNAYSADELRHNPLRQWTFTTPEGKRIDITHDPLARDNSKYSFDVYDANGDLDTSRYAGDTREDLMDSLNDVVESGRPIAHSQWVNGEPKDFRENIILTDEGSYNTYSNHFQSPGYVAHTRVSGRDLEGGGKVLYVDEIQSDIHQDGRKKGYQPNDYDFKIESLGRSKDEALFEQQRVYDDIAKLDAQELINTAIESGFTFDFPDVNSPTPKMRRMSVEDFVDDRIREFEIDPSGPVPENIRKESIRIVANNIREELKEELRANARSVSNENTRKLIDANPDLADLVKRYTDAEKQWLDSSAEFNNYKEQYGNSVPNVPLKDGKHVEAMLYQSINRAIELDRNGIAVSNASDQKRIYIDRVLERKGVDKIDDLDDPELRKTLHEMEALYDQQYDKTIPDLLKKIGKKYGVTPKRVKIKDKKQIEDDGGLRWYLPITPEMKEVIQKRGMPLYGKVKDGLLKPDEEQQSNFGGLLA